MSIAVALLLFLLAAASEAVAEDPSPTRQLRLSSRELTALLLNSAPSRADTIEIDATSDAAAERAAGLPPLFTLLPPQPVDPKEGGTDEPPLFAFGARIQGRTLIAFTRPGTKTDPDDRVVYQRLVVSDLFQGRRFAVTVFEDHALGGGGTQVLGFGARLLLRPAFTIAGWRTRVEMFASYDMTLGAVGSIGITARSPAPPVIVPVVPFQ
jgi:hypothetical protein